MMSRTGRLFLFISAAILLLIGAILGFIYFSVEAKLNRVYAIADEAIPIPEDPQTIAHGEHFVTALLGCTDCHGDDLSGRYLYDDPLFGRIAASNLTPGKGGIESSAWEDISYIDRAVRHGVGPGEKPLLYVMASFYQNLSDKDVAAIAAYLKNLPPVDNLLPETTVGLLTRFFILTDPSLLPAQVIDHQHDPNFEPTPEASVEYGRYLASACTTCHQEDFSGGVSVAAGGLNLTPGGDLSEWTEEDFIRTLRSGVTPEGTELDPEKMPWKRLRHLTDQEMKAIWMYLQTLPAVKSPPE
jgi:cytochrome c553